MSTVHEPAPRGTGRVARRLLMLSAATVAALAVASPALALPPNPDVTPGPVGTTHQKRVSAYYCAEWVSTGDGWKYVGIVRC